jgi:hypothetical protein
MKRVLLATVSALTSFAMFSNVCNAQMITTEERFQDLFVSAGYGAAFGAAFGAAMLSFQPKPDQNLRYVAIGASVGFIGGTVLGTYMIVSPSFSAGPEELPTVADNTNTLRIQPTFDPSKRYQLTGLQGQWTVARF